MSEKQLKVIKSVGGERMILGNIIAGFAILVTLLIVPFLVLATVLSLVAHGWNSGETTGMISGVGGLTALWVVAIVFRSMLVRKARAKYVLRTTRGTVRLQSVSMHSSNNRQDYKQHQMTVGGVLFVLDDEMVGKIKEGEDYAIYYLDYQDGSEGIIQSLEKLN